jgi:hypothetical protein
MDITKVGGNDWNNLAGRVNEPRPVDKVAHAKQQSKLFLKDVKLIDESTEMSSMLTLQRDKQQRQFTK